MTKNYDYNSYEEFENYECEDFECNNFENRGYEWTEEDSWDSLTDGMYGDMPSSPWAYDAMMESMGF